MTGRMARSPNAESSHHSIEPNQTSELLPGAEKFHFKIADNTRMEDAWWYLMAGGERGRAALPASSARNLRSSPLVCCHRPGAEHLENVTTTVYSVFDILQAQWDNLFICTLKLITNTIMGHYSYIHLMHFDGILEAGNCYIFQFL